ncbi:hypothetical protein FACS1894199_15450 [Bacteroidia bacterium]|nr:hypothetical protein FACS1894199_15450 [Bacteroidia bacterium]
MEKKTFNVQEWLNKSKSSPSASACPSTAATVRAIPCGCPSIDTTADIEIITERIERAKTDIASTYADWRDLGFALSDELGEAGRTYYHRLSRYYPNYATEETDKQYDSCLNAHGHGITIKTFYHLAQTAGINIGRVDTRAQNKSRHNILPISPKKQNGDMAIWRYGGENNMKMGNTSDDENEDEEMKPLPTIPETVYENIPNFLKQCTEKAISAEDRDLLLLSSLVVISACLPNIYGIYAERNVYPNLFLFVTAQASAGKGRLTLCRKLVEPIHRALRDKAKIEQQEYQNKLSEYAASKEKTDIERPQEPPMLMLIIPANNSATGLFQILNDNKGVGLIFETEGDTLAQTFKSEHGNYSDGFRKAFHHETISYNRRKNREYVELEAPRLSALLSGTPQQVASLIPNAENGLFSRFMFYFMNIKPVWNDVFVGNDNQTLDDYFKQLGNQFHDLYKHLIQHPTPLRFCLTKSQQQTFNDYFAKAQNQYICLYGNDYIATVRRLGLITFRIAMILTTLRIMETGNITPPMQCTDTDFNTAMEIVKILIQHAAQVYQRLPAEATTSAKQTPKQKFLEALPAEFARQNYLSTAQQLSITEKTAERYISKFVQSGLLTHLSHDKYKKT